MVVSVQFFGAQCALTKTRKIQIPLTNNGRVIDVLEYLMGCYPDLPLSKEATLVTVNNRASNMSQLLNHEDSIIFLPHVGGG